MKWMEIAWAELGQKEIEGPGTNAHIKAYFAQVGRADVARDEIAWCGGFAGYCLDMGGVGLDAVPVSDRLLANSYLRIGTETTEMRVGALCVLKRGSNPAQGHVGFVVAWTVTHVQLLGGNQNDSVSVEWFSRERIRGLRWPETVRAKDLDKAGSRITKAAAKVRRDTVAETALEVSKQIMDGMPAPGPADFDGAEKIAASFGQWAAHKWPVLAVALQIFLLARIVYHSGMIRGWRAEDASTGKTVTAGG